jgi:hypothetical protein
VIYFLIKLKKIIIFQQNKIIIKKYNLLKLYNNNIYLLIYFQYILLNLII